MTQLAFLVDLVKNLFLFVLFSYLCVESENFEKLFLSFIFCLRTNVPYLTKNPNKKDTYILNNIAQSLLLYRNIR